MADDILSKADLLTKTQQNWDELNAYLKTLNETQLATLTDAAGWTVKDHLIHIANWEEDMCVLLDGQCRWEAMNIDLDIWRTDDWDKINAVVHKRTRELPLAEALKRLRANHQRLMAKLQALSDEDLKRPYRHYQPESTLEAPIFGWIKGCTYQHFAEHLPWMQAISAGR